MTCDLHDRRSFIGGVAASGVAAFATRPTSAASGDASWVSCYVGTQGAGPTDGIHRVRLNLRTGAMAATADVAPLPRATWLLRHPASPTLYATSEIGGATSVVAAFAIAPDATLRALGQRPSGGGGATHLGIDPRRRMLAVANYGTGHVAVLPLARDGSLSPPAAIVQDVGTGPHRRQASAHAHGLAFDPTGRFLLVADLGADRIFVLRVDPRSNAMTVQNSAVAPPGSGPRHLAFSRNGRFVYCVRELTAEVAVFAWNGAAGTLTDIETHPLAVDDAPVRSASELLLSGDGRFLYAGDRGGDAIVVFRVDVATGRLSQIQRRASGGRTPWSFALAPGGRWLVVAHQGSETVSVLGVDPRTGLLGTAAGSVAVPKPVSIAF